MDIPYTVGVRRDTGLTNGKIGIWLFLAFTSVESPARRDSTPSRRSAFRYLRSCLIRACTVSVYSVLRAQMCSPTPS